MTFSPFFKLKLSYHPKGSVSRILLFHNFLPNELAELFGIAINRILGKGVSLIDTVVAGTMINISNDQ